MHCEGGEHKCQSDAKIKNVIKEFVFPLSVNQTLLLKYEQKIFGLESKSYM